MEKKPHNKVDRDTYRVEKKHECILQKDCCWCRFHMSNGLQFYHHGKSFSKCQNFCPHPSGLSVILLKFDCHLKNLRIEENFCTPPSKLLLDLLSTYARPLWYQSFKIHSIFFIYNIASKASKKIKGSLKVVKK